VTLDVETIEAIADAVSDRLDAREQARTGWVTADAVACHLGVEPSYVYEHSTQLGAVRLGQGPKARLRFRLDLVDASLCSRSKRSESPETRIPTLNPGRRRAQRRATTVPLLSYRGQEG
jgi:hypothetical protein